MANRGTHTLTFGKKVRGSEPGASNPAPGAIQDGVNVADLLTLFTVFERLGLKAEARKEQLDVYVIEHIEKPTEN